MAATLALETIEVALDDDDDEGPAPAATSSAPPSSQPRATRARVSQLPVPLPEDEDSDPPSVRWTNDQIFLMLELYGEARAEGDPTFDKGPKQRVLLTGIAGKLSERWPRHQFGFIKLKRKIALLKSIWKTFLGIQRSGTSYDNDTGQIGTSDESWEHWEQKYGQPAKQLRRNGLPRRDLYERAFVGCEAVGLTAVEAGDIQGLAAIAGRQPIEVLSSGEELEEEINEGQQRSQSQARPANSQPRAHRSQPPGTPARARAASFHASQPAGRTPLSVPPRRPHRATDTSSRSGLGAIEPILTALLSSRRHSHRMVGVTDLEAAIEDAQERFPGQATQDEIEIFCEALETRPARVIRYNTSTVAQRERLFWRTYREHSAWLAPRARSNSSDF